MVMIQDFIWNSFQKLSLPSSLFLGLSSPPPSPAGSPQTQSGDFNLPVDSENPSSWRFALQLLPRRIQARRPPSCQTEYLWPDSLRPSGIPVLSPSSHVPQATWLSGSCRRPSRRWWPQGAGGGKRPQPLIHFRPVQLSGVESFLGKGRHGPGDTEARGPLSEGRRGLLLWKPRPEEGVRPGGQAVQLGSEKLCSGLCDGGASGPQLRVPGGGR